MRQLQFIAALGLALLATACDDDPPTNAPIGGGNLVECEGAACNYDDGTPK